ncbi:LysR family transcriptional regulator [Pseudoduganella sp. UC29_106]|uniref:LysR family transcriptional regulator n=1 Tax=Pseudoduganella sp. UC29_106 TaxID=3374553 RepID=UPI00375756C4
MDSKTVEDLWSHIRTLGVLAESGSYTAAAQCMDVSKSAISLRIAELERATGVALVRRTTRSVRLTEAGQQLVDSTRLPFEEISQHFASVRDKALQPSGLLRVTAPVALGRQQIVPRMSAFLQAHPAVRVELELSDRLSSLSQEGFDLAIRHTNAAPETHVAWTLCHTWSVLVATKAYLKRHGTPDTPQALADHACLTYLRRGEQPSWSFERVKGDKQRVSVGISGSFSANNSEALREAALGGLGIALLPDFSAQADVAAGRLTVVLPDWRPVGAFGEKLLALRPYSPYVPRAVRAYVDYLRAELKSGFGAV